MYLSNTPTSLGETRSAQACGCPSVSATKDGLKLNTTICVRGSGENIVVPTSSICSYESICLDGGLQDHGLCKYDSFVCSNGKRISDIEKCDYDDDCGSGFYEDEANCGHKAGITCLYSDSTYDVKDLLIWVPPNELCEGERKCENVQCKEAFNCTAPYYPPEQVQVYREQLCDPMEYEYCNQKELSHMNCPGNDWVVMCDYTYQGVVKEVTIGAILECNGNKECDNGEDERCTISPGGCVEHVKRITTGSCTDIKSDYIMCPTNERSDVVIEGVLPNYIHLDLACDGKKDCENDEEVFCPNFDSSSNFFVHQYDIDFEPQCVPGMMDPTCEKRFIYYQTEHVCLGGIKNCTEIHNIDYCIYSQTNDLKCMESMGSISESLTMFVTSDKPTDYGFKRCLKDNLPIPLTKWCDTIMDCKDGSDEEACKDTNTPTFDCGEGTVGHKRYLPMEQKCDGVSNCPNRQDECNESCEDDSSRNILTWKYVPVAGFIGVTATLVNLFSLVKHAIKVKSIRQTNSFINESFIALIAVGDLLVGAYMLCVLAATLVYGGEYCASKYEWLSSRECSVLGVASTTGTLVSMLSMTTLSLFRMISLKTMISSGEVTAMKRLKVILVCTLIVAAALTIAVVPIIDAFSDYFVNGLRFQNNPYLRGVSDRYDISMFIDSFNKSDDVPRLYTNGDWYYYENALKNLYLNESENTKTSYKGEKIGFYGNQGVCLFKYFVWVDDPQLHFSVAVIALSATCFVVISCCYIFIFKYASSSFKTSGATEAQKNSMTRLQRKITFIITTDFLTWIPFILISILHLLQVLDATPLYEFCSILLIPINSVINPVIYNGDRAVVKLRNFVSQRICKGSLDDSARRGTQALNIDMVELPKKTTNGQSL